MKKNTCEVTGQIGLQYHAVAICGYFGIIITDDYIYIARNCANLSIGAKIGAYLCQPDCSNRSFSYTPELAFTLDKPTRKYYRFRSSDGQLRRFFGFNYKGMDAFDYLHEKLGSFNIYRKSYYLVNSFCGSCGSCSIGPGYLEKWLNLSGKALCCANHIRTSFVVREVALPTGEVGTEFFDGDDWNSQSAVGFRMFY